jgi:hypothetical protein
LIEAARDGENSQTYLSDTPAMIPYCLPQKEPTELEKKEVGTLKKY